eukprot:6909778-Prymnesium_polylepis.1
MGDQPGTSGRAGECTLVSWDCTSGPRRVDRAPRGTEILLVRPRHSRFRQLRRRDRHGAYPPAHRSARRPRW